MYGRPDKQLRRREFFSFLPVLLISIFTLSVCILTVSLPYFNRTVPMHKYSEEPGCTLWEEHSYQSPVNPVKNKTMIIIVVCLIAPTGDKSISAKFQKHIYQIPSFYV